MSWRTIVEINHDYIHDLSEHPEEFSRLLMELRSGSFNGELNKGKTPELCNGIRALGMRHHADEMTIKVR